jgi:flagellar biosynthesis protein FlhF
MRLKIYRGPTLADVMAQARNELGSEALILSTRRTAAGMELTAALDQTEDEPTPLPPPPSKPPPEDNPLAWHGIPEPIARRLAAGKLEHTLPTVLRFGVLPLGTDMPPLLLTGPPGAGKTLTIARLATRLVLAGTQPLVITADGRRAGAPEELAAYTRLLGLSLIVADQPATLMRALRHRSPGTPVLIDTSGVNPFEGDPMDVIQALTTAAAATPVLVLPAGQDPLEAAEQAAAFAETGVRHFIPTRLDIARRLGSVVAAASEGGFVLTEAGTGPGANDGLTALTPAALAARLAQHGAQPAPPHQANQPAQVPHGRLARA